MMQRLWELLKHEIWHILVPVLFVVATLAWEYAHSQHTQVATTTEDGKPFSQVSLIVNGQNLGTTDQYGEAVIPSTNGCLRCYFGDELLDIRNSHPGIWHPSIRLSAAQREITIILRHPTQQ